MKKRMLATLLVLAMALSLMPPVAFAAETEDYAQIIADANAMSFDGELPTYCPKCGEGVTWTALTQESDVWNDKEKFSSGHYYLAGDISGTYANGTLYLAEWTLPGGPNTVCLHLNGHTLENTSDNAIKIWTPYTLNVMGNGVVRGSGATRGTVTNCSADGVLNVYGGDYYGWRTFGSEKGTVRLYNAAIKSGFIRPASSSNVTLYDGTYKDVRMDGNNDTVTLKNATITKLQMAGSGTVNVPAGSAVTTLDASSVAEGNVINISGDGTVGTLKAGAATVVLSGKPTVTSLTGSMPIDATGLTGGSINLNGRTGTFTAPFASKEAAQAAIPYFVNAGDTITVNKQNCLTAGRDAYLVGYSKVDINPYAEDGTILPLSMAGYNDDATRLALPEKLDDNGDGIVDENDGIFATCTAITDKNGNTALVFTADLLWGYNGNYGGAVLDALLGEEFKEYGLDESRIFFNGSHNHFAPNMAGGEEGDVGTYNAYLRSQFIDAARQALADRAWADMYQGSMEVEAYFNENDGARKNEKVGDLLNQMHAAAGAETIDEVTYASRVGNKDVMFTCVRHFKITEQRVYTDSVGFITDKGVKYPTGGIIDESAPEYTYYAGNGTNGDWVGVGHINTIYEHDPKTGIVYDGTVDPETGKLYDESVAKEDRDIRIKEYRKVTKVEEATETDDTLRVVAFRFGNDSGKEPVVMINWRGHLPSNAGIFGVDENKNTIITPYKTVSGGMVNALRNAMAFSGYRASFLQGQTGNINMQFLGTEGSWMTATLREKCNVFGTELAQLTLNVLQDADKINEDGGEIRSVAQIYQGEQYRSTAFEFMAANRYLEQVAANDGKEIGRRVYTNLYYYVDENGQPLLDSNGLPITEGAVGDPILLDEPITITTADRASTMRKRYQLEREAGKFYTEVMLNALTIGDEFKMTSVAAEIFDHYIGENGENLWDTLKAEHNDPFILGCTNSSTGSGYMPDKNTYNYMHSGKDPNYVVGTYESSCRFAEGYGEDVVLELDAMLDFLGSDHPAGVNTDGKCAHCGETVTWTDLSREVREGYLRYDRKFTAGHYYLPEGKTVDLTTKNIPEGVEVCIDLNGQTLNVAQSITVNGKLSIVDSKASGTVIGTEGLRQGGVFCVNNGGQLDIYGGTYRYDNSNDHFSVASGGIVYNGGTFTLYDGTLEGTSVGTAGGTVLTNGKAFLRGGTVKSGFAPNANGGCITVYGEVTLAGDANIEDLFYIGGSSETQRLHIDGNYTGTVSMSGMVKDVVIGNAINNADTSLATITSWHGSRRYYPEIHDGQVIMRLITHYVAQNSQTGEYIYGDYRDRGDQTANPENVLQNVLDTLPDGSRVVMLESGLSSTATYNIQSNLLWDIKGRQVNCTFNVAQGKTIQFADCKGTGKINLTKVNGQVENAPASADGKTQYIPITDEEDWTTFQEARLNIDQLVLRADNKDENGKASPGLYFRHRFDGDEVVKDLVESYGIAFSLSGTPTEADLKAEGTLLYEDGIVYRSGNVVYTKLDGAQFGEADADSTSALITGVMKEENGASINTRNAQMPIYGVAYIKLTNGNVVLGSVRRRSFQEQLEGIDTKWDDLTDVQRKGVLKMYKLPTVKSVVDKWNTPNLKNPAKSQADTEKDVLRILAIGNSHTVDATNLLCKVFAAQMPDQKVMIGNMYYSGCAVSQHLGFEASDAPVYVYYNYSYDPETGEKSSQTKETTLRQGLNDQVWDIVILHEMNSSAGSEKTYTGTNKRNLQKHINYIKTNCLNSDPKFIWNFSWANPTSEYLWGLGYPAGENYDWVDSYEKTYGNDYNYMLSQMVKMTKSYVMTNSDIDDVIPTGLAVDFLRKHEDNPNKEDPDVLLYRDYTHMSDFGRLMTSYLWFATITGKTEIDNVNIDVIPKYSRVEQNWPQGDMEVTQDMKDMIQKAVKNAVSQKGTLLPE